MSTYAGSPLGAGTRSGDGVPSTHHPRHGSYENPGPNPSHWLPSQYNIIEPNAAYAWNAQQQHYANQSYSPYNPNTQNYTARKLPLETTMETTRQRGFHVSTMVSTG